MQVLLVRPPRRTRYEPGLSVPPLGLAYIASSLESAGHSVRILDAYALRWSWAQFVETVREIRPNVLGLSAMTPTADSAAKTLAACAPFVGHTVLGGPHPTAVGDSVFDEMPELDAAVIGEGEDIAPRLLSWWERGEAGSPPDGVRTRHHPYVAAKQVPNIHTIERPARQRLPNASYRYLFATRPGFTTMITSRGCPFRCSFCDKSVSGSRWRAREPEDIVDEMAQVHRDHDVGFINFYDDNFTLRRERVVAICEEILRTGLSVDWKCEGRVDSVDRELLELMRRAGCRCVAYGVESGNAPSLELLRKDIRIDQVQDAFRATREAGLRSLAYMILGVPGEGAEEVQRSVRFCREIGADYAQFSTLVAMPGTPLFEHRANRSSTSVSGPLDSDLRRETLTDLPPEELAVLLRRAWTGFYLRPRPLARIVRDAWRSGSIDEALYLGKNMGQWLKRPTDERSIPAANL